MPLLRSLRSPEDLRALAPEQLPALAAEIRDALVTSVAKSSGHLGPNLGCVELADQLPPDAMEAAIRAYEREGARLTRAARGVEVVAGALRGERWVPRL